MAKRRTVEQIQRLLKDADRDLAKGVTAADLCRKFGLTQSPDRADQRDRGVERSLTDANLSRLRSEAHLSSTHVRSAAQ